MSSSFKVTTPVDISQEPVTLTEVKQLLRIDWTDDDNILQTLISRARAYAETVTHRALATQTIQQVDTIERPIGGELSGPINRGPNWYQYQEQLGANPFGAAQFYFDLAMPPVQSISLIETMITAFDGTWTAFAGNTYLDNNREPARLYIQAPVTANFWRFTYVAGYLPATYPIPYDIKQCIAELASHWYDNREGSSVPEGITKKLLSRRVDWL